MFQLAEGPIGGIEGGGGKGSTGYWNVILENGNTNVWTNTNSEFDSIKQITQIESYYKENGITIRQMKFVDGEYTIWETPRDAKFYRAKINSNDPKIKNNLLIAAENYDAAITAAQTFGITKSISDRELIFMGSIR
jgi:hypothetical protein